MKRRTMKRSGHGKSRRAVSLIELMLIMSAATVLLTLTGALMHRVMHSQSKARAFDDAQRTAFRLSEQFRRDVAEAVTVDLPANNAEQEFLFRLQIAEQTVEYRRDRNSLRRISQTSGDSLKTLSREDFTFPTLPTFAIRLEQAGKLVVLTATAEAASAHDAKGNPQQATYATPLALEVVAARGVNSTPVSQQSPSDVPTQESPQ